MLSIYESLIFYMHGMSIRHPITLNSLSDALTYSLEMPLPSPVEMTLSCLRCPFNIWDAPIWPKMPLSFLRCPCFAWDTPALPEMPLSCLRCPCPAWDASALPYQRCTCPVLNAPAKSCMLLPCLKCPCPAWDAPCSALGAPALLKIQLVPLPYLI